MAKRKKTSDIMEELLGGRPVIPKPESKKTGEAKSGNKAPGEGPASPDKAPEKEADPDPQNKPESELPNRPDPEPLKQAAAAPEHIPEELIPTFEALKGEDLDPPRHFVSFRLGTQLYALPLGDVESAVRMVALTPLPEAPSWVAGAVNFHGSVVPALDLRKRLGGETRKPRPDDYLLLVKGFERAVALIVDEVTEIVEVPARQVESPSGPLARSRSLAGMIRREEELILILDPGRLVPE